MSIIEDPLSRLKRWVAIICVANFFLPYPAKAETPVTPSGLVFRIGVLELNHNVKKPKESRSIPKQAPKPQLRYTPKPNKSAFRVSSIAPNSCSCVNFSKSKTNYRQSIGIARNWARNTNKPVVGGVVILNESRAGHVAYITAVNGNSFDVIEANYVRCKITTRTLNTNYQQIIGYWK